MDPHEVRERWTSRDDEYSPAYYAYYGPNETSERLRELLGRHVEPDAPVLELGCSSGRHLAHLHEHGFGDLSGIDVNDDAFDVMAETYPGLADEGTFYRDGIEDVVADFDDGAFDAVYSVETLQHLHPDLEWVFPEIARVTSELLVTVENEGGNGDGGARPPSGGGGSGGERVADGAGLAGDDGDGPTVDDVTHLHAGVPLYHRPWGRVFTRLGLEEVESRAGEKDTMRAFRAARD